MKSATQSKLLFKTKHQLKLKSLEETGGAKTWFPTSFATTTTITQLTLKTYTFSNHGVLPEKITDTGVDRGLNPCIIRVERNETQTRKKSDEKHQRSNHRIM